MRCSLAIAVVLLAGSGCVTQGPTSGWPESAGPVVYDNPALVPVADHDLVWETVVDVIDDDFQIDREVPVRQYGDVLTEGRLDTFPLVGSTILEPWHGDAVNLHEKMEGTLQSIRRQAVVRVIPAQGGHWVEVVVRKELEDVAQPLEASAGSATFRYDNSLTRVIDPITEVPTHRGWIPLGRDTALEQRLLGEIQARLCGAARRPVPMGVGHVSNVPGTIESCPTF
jgi:hypothetical protein